MSSLFNLTEQYRTVLQLAEEGADQSAIDDALAHIDDQIEDKADGYAAVIKHLKGNIEMIKTESDRLTALKKTHENAIKRMKDNLMAAMQDTGKLKFKTSVNNFYVKKNPISLIVQNEDYIPSDFYVVKRVLDKKALKEYLLEHENETVNGVGLEQSKSVVIR